MPVTAANAKPTDNRAIVATDLTKWFGEGDAKMTAVNARAASSLRLEPASRRVGEKMAM